MSDYKLVPVEPTAEMIEAAKDAYMPFGDMEMALRMALLSAPAVQGEPVVTDEMIEAVQRIRETAMRQSVVARIPECGEFSGIAQDAGWLLGALRPAAHQPCPEGVREGAPYDDPAFSALCREHEIWGTAAAAQCAVFWEAGKRVAEQQPAPDVAGLVEALEQGFPLLSDEGLDEVEHHCEYVIQRERKRVHSILADYRKETIHDK